MKRYLAFLLTLLLAFAFVLPVFAEEAEDEEETMVLFAESEDGEDEEDGDVPQCVRDD